MDLPSKTHPRGMFYGDREKEHTGLACPSSDVAVQNVRPFVCTDDTGVAGVAQRPSTEGAILNGGGVKLGMVQAREKMTVSVNGEDGLLIQRKNLRHSLA